MSRKRYTHTISIAKGFTALTASISLLIFCFLLLFVLFGEEILSAYIIQDNLQTSPLLLPITVLVLLLFSFAVSLLILYPSNHFLIAPLQKLRDYSTGLERAKTNITPPHFPLRELEQISNNLTQMVQHIATRDTADLAKTQFIANTSHDIRTSINGIVGLITLLHNSELNDEQVERVQLIKDSTGTLLDLVNNVLDLSQIEYSNIEPEEVDYDLRDLVRLAVDTRKPAATAKELSLRAKIDAELPQWIKGDRNNLRRVLINLVDNAIKFTETGTITLKVDLIDQEQKRVRFAVRDTGIGISAKQQKHIFSPFTQVDSSRTPPLAGSGLGLAISQQLVAMMGGTLTVESALGWGSEFSFSLPWYAGSPPSAIPCSDSTRNESVPLQILLAEDNSTNRIVTRDLLELDGHRVAVADNGRQAVSAAMGTNFDVILMDIKMSEMDGIEATHKIRTLEKNTRKRVPIIAFTAHAAPGDEDRFIEAGMDGYLTKPLEPKRLLEAIARAGTKPQVLDPSPWEELEQRATNGRMNLRHYTSVFLNDAPKRLQGIGEALTARDCIRLEREAHSLLGGAREFGAYPLMMLCQQMEEMGSASRIEEDAGELLADIEAEIEKVRTEIESRVS